jgi:hypothetical protein
MSARRDKHFRLPVNLVADFAKTATILGLSETQAAEIALREWVQRNRNEAQKRLDMYAEKGIVINEPESITVNVTVFQKAELLLAKEELQRLLGVLPDIQDPASRRETQLELAKALKMTQPVFVKSRDPELAELLKEAEQALQQ